MSELEKLAERLEGLDQCSEQEQHAVLRAAAAALRECAKRRTEPDEERVERVARAIIAAENGDPEQIVYQWTGPDSFEPLGAAWELFKPKARAAIRAMEE